MREQLLKIKVVAGAAKESVVSGKSGRLVVSVKPEAERNMANVRACELVSKYLKIPIKSLRIIKGHHSPSKILSIISSETK